MTTNRNLRIRSLTTAAGLGLAALSLTACGNDGSGVRDEGRATNTSFESAASTSSASTSPEPAPAPSSQHDAQPTSSGSKAEGQTEGQSDSKAGGKAATKPGGTKGGGTTGTKFVTCQGSNTKTVAAPLTRPVNHLLLTVTNTGGNPCYLYYYPAVRFGEAQSVPPVIEDSQPQAVVTLAPGESGYASVNLSAADGSGGKGHWEKSLAVYFQGRTASQNPTSAAHPALPAKGVWIDDSVAVTYWQQSMDDAISW
ncbi:DUF4232 domain-containing protein [Streptomyces sp. NPDC048182]|uniref:DUF4232 domain-containing protein n=1 Tax=Streptomyces sp. NPDC048182 TaxID=3365507 RepID=UPI003718820B